MEVLRIDGLPADPLAAAAAFHADWLPNARAMLDRGCDLLVVQFTPADHTHRAWRLAVIQGLAREYAPQRANGVVAQSEQGLSAAMTFLDKGQGITGQYLVLDEASVVLEAP